MTLESSAPAEAPDYPHPASDLLTQMLADLSLVRSGRGADRRRFSSPLPDQGEVEPRSGSGEGKDYSPAIVISAILIVGAAVDERQCRSVPSICVAWYMSFRLPAIVISCTG